MNINVIRQQWPIGQGCFANGSISTDNRTFTYVYDCGSNNLNPLRQSIRQLDPNNNLIDALFISHLDSDHVNGIDFLCSSCGYSVDTVYLPYLSIIDCLIIIGASLANDSFTWNLAEAVINPRKWFKQRGV
ncbi:MAG: MBL fold metallo-hydrolase, partial [Planctomycetota bacterium]